MNALLACLGILVLPSLAVSGGVVSIIAAREAEWMLRRSRERESKRSTSLRKPGTLLPFPLDGGASTTPALQPTRPA